MPIPREEKKCRGLEIVGGRGEVLSMQLHGRQREFAERLRIMRCIRFIGNNGSSSGFISSSSWSKVWF